MTDRFNPNDPEHLAIKKGIEIGDGIEACTACLLCDVVAAANSFTASWC